MNKKGRLTAAFLLTLLQVGQTPICWVTANGR